MFFKKTLFFSLFSGLAVFSSPNAFGQEPQGKHVEELPQVANDLGEIYLFNYRIYLPPPVLLDYMKKIFAGTPFTSNLPTIHPGSETLQLTMKIPGGDHVSYCLDPFEFPIQGKFEVAAHSSAFVNLAPNPQFNPANPSGLPLNIYVSAYPEVDYVSPEWVAYGVSQGYPAHQFPIHSLAYFDPIPSTWNQLSSTFRSNYSSYKVKAVCLQINLNGASSNVQQMVTGGWVGAAFIDLHYN